MTKHFFKAELHLLWHSSRGFLCLQEVNYNKVFIISKGTWLFVQVFSLDIPWGEKSSLLSESMIFVKVVFTPQLNSSFSSTTQDSVCSSGRSRSLPTFLPPPPFSLSLSFLFAFLLSTMPCSPPHYEVIQRNQSPCCVCTCTTLLRTHIHTASPCGKILPSTSPPVCSLIPP